MRPATVILSNCPKALLLQSVRLLFCLLCMNLAQPFAALAQTNAPATLPPAAQEAVNKGIIAAKVPDYLLAIRYFEDARKIAPQAPVIYLNMGLAESKIPGRELRAIAWFGAYLAAYPDAPNAAAVKEQIAVLEVRNQSNVSRLIKSAQDAGNQISGVGKERRLRVVAKLWTKAGDIAAALKIVDLTDDLFKDDVKLTIAVAQANAGDFAGAQKTANLIQNASVKGLARSSIASAMLIAQATAGDLKAAQKTVSLIDKGWDRTTAVQALVEALARSGDIKTAIAIADKEDLALNKVVEVQANAGDIVGARKTADMVTELYDAKSWALASIATAQANAGDIVGAQKTSDLIKRSSSPMSKARLALVKAQAKADDISGALKSMDVDLHLDTKCEGFVAIAEAQARAGDSVGAQKSLAAAKKSVDSLDDYRTSRRLKADLRESISVVQAKIGSMDLGMSNTKTQSEALNGTQRAVSNWISKLNNGNIYHDCPLNAGLFQDLAGHLKSLPRSDDPEKVFELLQETAEKIVDAQHVITGMLRQQAGK